MSLRTEAYSDTPFKDTLAYVHDPVHVTTAVSFVRTIHTNMTVCIDQHKHFALPKMLMAGRAFTSCSPSKQKQK